MDDVPVDPEQSANQRFFELMLEEIGKGYTRGSKLKDESWEFICQRLNRDYAGGVRIFNVLTMKENMVYYREQYNYFSALLALDGVQWDIGTNEVTATKSVWKAYYKVILGIVLLSCYFSLHKRVSI